MQGWRPVLRVRRELLAGYVRRASSYKIPDPEAEDVLTIGREGGTEGKEDKDKK